MHQELSEKLCYMPRAWISHNDIKWIKQYFFQVHDYLKKTPRNIHPVNH